MKEETKKYHSKQEAKLKIEHFCSYQERCQQEVNQKLYSYGLHKSDVDELLVHLVQNNFLNEERFAIAYAGGKFRQKKWGKNKILLELKKRQISAYCIKKAMREIEDNDYLKTIQLTAEKYAEKQRGEKPYIAKQKTIKYMLSRGFEYDACHEIISALFV